MQPQTFRFGITDVTFTSFDLLDGINTGMHGVYSHQPEFLSFSAETLLQYVLDSIHAVDVDPVTGEALPQTWQIGKTIGELFALCHPDIAQCCLDDFGAIASLSEKSVRNYQQHRQMVEATQETQA